MCEEYCGDRGFLWRSVGLPEVVSGGTMKINDEHEVNQKPFLQVSIPNFELEEK